MRPGHVLLLPLALVVGGCGGGEPRPVPDVRGQRLDLAERRLDDAGLEYERVGGGTFGIVVSSNWRVCDQEPKGGEAVRVRLVVGRSCPAPTHFVPDLVGEELERARDRLDRREVPYRVVGSREGTSLVCNQNPPGGGRAPEVVLYVRRSCTPPPPPPLPPLLPETRGLDLAEAEELLAVRGVAVVVEPPTSAGHHDVCRQDPPGGRRAWDVTLHVAPRC
jgi:beta-lactam-binding protein with PASTA domain